MVSEVGTSIILIITHICLVYSHVYSTHMDKEAQQKQYPGYETRRQITITHLVSTQGPSIYVVEDKYNQGGLERESKIKRFDDTSMEDVIKEYFCTPDTL